MNFLAFYVLASNFIVFWGFGLMSLFSFYQDDAPGGVYAIFLLGMVVVGTVISMLPFLIPLLVTAVLGFTILSYGDDIWLFSFLGTALFLGSVGLLFLYEKAGIDGLKARYWRHLWTHKSALEERIGASSPYVEMESEDNWRLLYYPILAPFLHFGLAMKEQEALQKAQEEARKAAGEKVEQA